MCLGEPIAKNLGTKFLFIVNSHCEEESSYLSLGLFRKAQIESNRPDENRKMAGIYALKHVTGRGEQITSNFSSFGWLRVVMVLNRTNPEPTKMRV